MEKTTFPKHWKSVRLGDICNIVMGQSPPSTTYNDKGIGMPFLQGKAEFTELFPDPIRYCTKQLRISPKGSVLMSVRAPVGDVNLADREYIIGRGLTSINLKCGNNRFLLYLFLHSKKELEAKSSGSTFKSINKAAINNFRISIPPLPEQRAIARILQAIQEAKLTRHREITLERERRAALMDHLFSHGTKGEPRKQTEIGEIPESWEIIQLAQIADVRAGGAFPIKYQGNKTGEYPFYKVSDMNIRGNETLMYRSNNWVKKDTIKTLKAKIFPKNTVIFPKVGAAVHTNKKRVLSIDGLVDNNVMGVTIRDENLCIPYYLLYWFESIDLGYLSNPGPLPAITAGKIKSTEIPLPSLSEQRAIADVFRTIDEKTAALEQEAQHLDELFHAMLDELMTGQRSAVPLIDTELPS